MPFSVYVTGFTMGLSLIVAIGAQNSFVLRQGLRNEHVFAVCLTCALSDAVLIAAGVAGFGTLSARLPWFGAAMRWLGVGFLIVYGALRFRAALRGGEALRPAAAGAAPLGKVLATCLVLTWANPHVYLDTVVVIGGVASALTMAQKVYFLMGAVSASCLWFFGLGFGARRLLPLFKNPRSWQILDAVIALVMWAIAGSLIWQAVKLLQA